MADTTEAEEKREQQQPFREPDFDAIIPLISQDGELHSGETRAQRAAADNAKIYTKIEKDHGGNKDAVKAVRRLVKLGRKDSDDFLRTFLPLIERMDLMPERDMVDYAEGAEFVTDGRRGAGFGYVAPSGDDDDDEEGDEIEDDSAKAAREAQPTPFQSAIDRSRTHFGDKPTGRTH